MVENNSLKKFLIFFSLVRSLSFAHKCTCIIALERFSSERRQKWNEVNGKEIKLFYSSSSNQSVAHSMNIFAPFYSLNSISPSSRGFQFIKFTLL